MPTRHSLSIVESAIPHPTSQPLPLPLPLPPDHHFSSREHPHGLYRVLRNYLRCPIIFSREAPPPAACLPSIPLFQQHHALTCEPNSRTILDPSGLLRDQSLATTTKAHRQPAVSPNSHAYHEATGILPCRGGGEGLVHSISPRDIAFSEGLNGFPRRSR
jgi:hypothetical protein